MKTSHWEVTSQKSLFRSELSIIDCRICTNCLLDHYSTGLRIARDCNLNKIKLNACLVSQTADPDYQSVITNHWLGRQYTVSRQYTIRLERSAEVVDPTEKGPTNREPPKRDQPKERQTRSASLTFPKHGTWPNYRHQGRGVRGKVRLQLKGFKSNLQIGNSKRTIGAQ